MTLEADRVDVERGGLTLVRAASLAVEPGECVAMIGPNGAGKSTLLHALSGAQTPARGVCRLDGRPLAEYAPAELARRRAVLPQAPALGFPLNVADVVALGRSPHAGFSDRGEDRRVIQAVLAEADIAHLSERTYPSLSGGERQRVHLARVLAQVWTARCGDSSARYLMLDEPTNNLDIAHQQRMIATAASFAQYGNGVLAVLHDPNLAAQYADRLVVLADGTVRANGPPDEVLTSSLMADIFGVTALCRTHPRTGRPFVLPA